MAHLFASCRTRLFVTESRDLFYSLISFTAVEIIQGISELFDFAILLAWDRVAASVSIAILFHEHPILLSSYFRQQSGYTKWSMNLDV